MKTKVVCGQCKGTGLYYGRYTPDDPSSPICNGDTCEDCDGTGVVSAPERVTMEVEIPGDRSVGIADTVVKMDFGPGKDYDPMFGDASMRKAFAKDLRDLFDTYFDPCGHCIVRYGDECPDCGSKECTGGCVDDDEENQFYEELDRGYSQDRI